MDKLVPISLENQLDSMKKYVIFNQKKGIKALLSFMGYYRLSRYGKFLIASSNSKHKVESLRSICQLDESFRNIFFEYCKTVEIQFKTNLADIVSDECGNSLFYLDESVYTKSRGEKDKNTKNRNVRYFTTFFREITDKEQKYRNNRKKYHEFKSYVPNAINKNGNLPCWAIFTQLEFGSVANIFYYLNLRYRNIFIEKGYGVAKSNKALTKEFDTWVDSVRNLRNACVHYNRIIGNTSSTVLAQSAKGEYLPVQNDLFARIYALKKLLGKEDADKMKNAIVVAIRRSHLDVIALNILPKDWEIKFDSISSL